jgi:omega-hydroxy-beta-dihydromenaquinone-9 sulfotransferase
MGTEVSEMGWREDFSRITGPGLILGITLGDLACLLWQNDFRVRPRYWSKVAFAGLISLLSTPIRRIENVVYGRRVAQQPVTAPLFIIGHWRSGTTHLHNLISIDPRFAYASFSQITIPHTFLVGERLLSTGSALFLPPDRMGVDKVAMHPQVPWEEEFALCLATFCSPYMSWVFPRRADHYDRYLTFRGVPAADVAHWKKAFVTLLQKLSWKYQRPLVLKSPPNTCRIRLILDIFPDARFVHIHRDPYVVYQSTCHLNSKCMEYYALQRPDDSVLHRRVIRQYSEMFEAFFEEKSLIPKDHFCEVSYADLVADPVGQVRQIYEKLALPAFPVVEPAVREYVRSLAGYEKNTHGELPADTRGEIARTWRRTFEEWGYPT